MSAAKQANNLYPVSAATFHPHPSVDPSNLMTDSEYAASLPASTPELAKLIELLSAVDNSIVIAPLNAKKLQPNGLISQHSPILAHYA
jgi:hypothetical protein